MAQTFVSVNKQTIARNARHGEKNPPIRIARGKSGKPSYAHEIRVSGPCRLVYDSEKPLLKCGARLVLVTDGDVEVIR